MQTSFLTLSKLCWTLQKMKRSPLKSAITPPCIFSRIARNIFKLSQVDPRPSRAAICNLFVLRGLEWLTLKAQTRTKCRSVESRAGETFAMPKMPVGQVNT